MLRRDGSYPPFVVVRMPPNLHAAHCWVYEVDVKTIHRGQTRFYGARFANDRNGRIVRWNREAEKLLGYKDSEVLGRSCHDIVCGRDIFGNRFCLPGCSRIGIVPADEPLRDFVMDVQTARGETVRARVRVRSRRTGLTRRLLIEHTIVPDD